VNGCIKTNIVAPHKYLLHCTKCNGSLNRQLQQQSKKPWQKIHSGMMTGWIYNAATGNS
jgi:hypothetical protein